MGDPSVRRKAVLSRLRKQLDKKRESLADQFDFKMYIVIHFKDKVLHVKLLYFCLFSCIPNKLLCVVCRKLIK